MLKLLKRYTAIEWLIIACIAGVFISLVGNFVPYDDTDPADGRSGMRLYTDAKTGCQYLAVRQGGMTPRLDRNGHHICETH